MVKKKHSDMVKCGGCGRSILISGHTTTGVAADTPPDKVTWNVVTPGEPAFTVLCSSCGQYAVFSYRERPE